MDILNKLFFNNTIAEYLTALGLFVVGFLVLKVLSNVILKRLAIWADRTKSTLDDFIVYITKKGVIPVAYTSLLYVAILSLQIPDQIQKYISYLYTIVVTYYITQSIILFFRYSLTQLIKRKSDDLSAETRIQQVKGMLTVLSIFIWTLALVFLLDNFGYNVATIITGLGVGGIAIAFASQAILGDLFSYFVIFFDRPFEIGDFIHINDKLGVVEHMGIKSTRIRSLGGELSVLSNKELTNSNIDNYKKMEQRRVLFKLGVTYNTSAEKLSKIPELIKQIINNEPYSIVFDRAHFSEYGDFCLVFEIVYYLKSPNYTLHMTVKESILLKIFHAFENEKIEFAFPTQTLYLHKVDPNFIIPSQQTSK